jgi:hypothetical protein
MTDPGCARAANPDVGFGPEVATLPAHLQRGGCRPGHHASVAEVPWESASVGVRTVVYAINGMILWSCYRKPKRTNRYRTRTNASWRVARQVQTRTLTGWLVVWDEGIEARAIGWLSVEANCPSERLNGGMEPVSGAVNHFPTITGRTGNGADPRLPSRQAGVGRSRPAEDGASGRDPINPTSPATPCFGSR